MEVYGFPAKLAGLTKLITSGIDLRVEEEAFATLKRKTVKSRLLDSLHRHEADDCG